MQIYSHVSKSFDYSSHFHFPVVSADETLQNTLTLPKYFIIMTWF